jgi:hypothetical protein
VRWAVSGTGGGSSEEADVADAPGPQLVTIITITSSNRTGRARVFMESILSSTTYDDLTIKRTAEVDYQADSGK